MNVRTTIEDVEIRLLLEGIFLHYGFDFRNYAPVSLKRRILQCLHNEQLPTISRLQEQVLHDPACMERFVQIMSVHVTSMFRYPEFYRVFRTEIVPLLRTYPFLRFWHAGCATGEEVFSMAILLHEEGLYERCRIYATDMNDAILQKAKTGISPLRAMKQYTNQYMKAGGRQAFSDYYTAQYDHILFTPALQRNIIWAQHNLVTDSSFNEFHVILCRNTMIYFNRALQERVHQLFYDSLVTFGFLGLGEKESLVSTPYADKYAIVVDRQQWYRKVHA